MGSDDRAALDAFAARAAAWLAENFPPSLAGRELEAIAAAPLYPEGDDWAAWKKAMAQNGWGVPTWPKEYGGGGLTPDQARMLQEEMNRIGAFTPIRGMAQSMFGPTMLEYGTEEQKRRHIPPVARGEIRWCQGYSEPGAGSDLASLRTRAEDMGDHYLINGQKIWTSGAMHAHWCFCLVRTDTARKHEGISFLLIDMSSPGVEVRPLRLISGNETFAEVFFTDVMVPKENLVGTENTGWTIAKRLMQHERAGLGIRSSMGHDPLTIRDMALKYVGTDENGRLDDPDLRTRIARHLLLERAQKLTAQRVADESVSGPSEAVSVLKNVLSEVIQGRGELLIEIMGLNGIGWSGPQFTEHEISTIRRTLHDKAHSIYGGTWEIQANIIAKRMLGMLDHQ